MVNPRWSWMGRKRWWRESLPSGDEEKESAKDSLVIMSPMVLYALLSVFSLSLMIFPSSVYEYFVSEPDLIAGNWRYGLFFLAGALVFALGALLFLGLIGDRLGRPIGEGNWTSVLLGLLALFGNSAVLIWLARSSLSNGNLLNSIFLGGYSKAAFDEAMGKTSLSWVFPTSVFALTLIFWKLLVDRNSSLFGLRRRVVRWLFYIDLALFVLVALASHGRGILVWLISSLFCVFMLWVASRYRPHPGLVVTIFTGLVLSVVVIFWVYQVNRHGDDDEALRTTQHEFVGYFLGGFNRFAAMLDGQMELPYSHQGYYSLQFIWNMPLLGPKFSALGREAGLDLPLNQEIMSKATFQSVRDANLNDRYIWTTIYGEPYADTGWYSLVLFLFFGFFSQLAWHYFRIDCPVGILGYAFAFYSLLWWPASPQFLDNTIIFLAVVIFLISLERRIIRKDRALAP